MGIDVKAGLKGMLGGPASGIGAAGNPLSGLGLIGRLMGGQGDEEDTPQAPVNPGQKMFGMGPGSDSGMARPQDVAHHKNFGGRLIEELFRSAIGGFR